MVSPAGLVRNGQRLGEVWSGRQPVAGKPGGAAGPGEFQVVTGGLPAMLAAVAAAGRSIEQNRAALSNEAKVASRGK